MSAHIYQLRRDVPPAKPGPERLPMNVGAYVHEILAAANSLLANDYQILSFFARYNPQQLMIELKDSPALRRLALLGTATYDDQGHDETGPYRTGFFTRGAVTAFWRERGGS